MIWAVTGAGNVADDTYNGGVAGTQNVLSSVQKSSTVKRLIYTSSLAAMNNSSGHWKPSGAEWTEVDWYSHHNFPEFSMEHAIKCGIYL